MVEKPKTQQSLEGLLKVVSIVFQQAAQERKQCKLQQPERDREVISLTEGSDFWESKESKDGPDAQVRQLPR